MTITNIDCYFYRGDSTTPETSSYTAVNPNQSPGNMIIAAAAATRDSIGSQVAAKLGLEHFINGVFEYYKKDSDTNRPSYKGNEEPSVRVLEAAFKNANNSVYSFGHKLAAGGRMAASLVGLSLSNDLIAAGRVGNGSVYLYRDGDIFPFFVDKSASSHKVGEPLIGSNSLVSVELASVNLFPQDILLVFSQALSLEQEEVLKELLGKIIAKKENPAELIAKYLYPDYSKIPFVLIARMGYSTIYLKEAV